MFAFKVMNCFCNISMPYYFVNISCVVAVIQIKKHLVQSLFLLRIRQACLLLFVLIILNSTQ